MKDIKDVLLYLDIFDKNNMFDFEKKNKLLYVSEMLSIKMYQRIEKHDWNYCEDAILDLNNLTVKIFDMFGLKKRGILQEPKKLYDAVLQYGNDIDTECEPLECDDYYVLSENSGTGGIEGLRNK